MISTSRDGIVHLLSVRTVDQVLEHLLSLLSEKSITVFAVVDHSGEAARVGLEMRATKLVIFGNPKAGTPLMLAEPDSALDLPLKLLIAQAANGTTRSCLINLRNATTRPMGPAIEAGLTQPFGAATAYMRQLLV
jgi:uncharacterized protein (DUF302 family)